MNYSRRQLEALGEPFGESATALKPGGRVYGGGGGGGQPQTSTQISELPEWARPYAQKALGTGEALAFSPYQRYVDPTTGQGIERIAGFSPMQLQAQQKIGQMGPASQLGQASTLAGSIGAAAQGTSYTPGSFTGGTFDTGAANQYMSPFMEAALEPQLREAQRTSAIQATQQAGQAVQSGAFGGGRAAILEAERQRNLGTQLGDIRARGYQTAFEQAASQFNQDQQRRIQAAQLGEQSRQFGAGLGLQGLGIGLQAAGQLGQLGQMQFGQEKDVLGLQRDVGKEQQALRQQGLTQAYQDFLEERNDPYKRLGFFSDLIRGAPLGQQSTRQIYEAPPSMLQTLGSIGMGAYGLKQIGMLAEGGSVTDERFVQSALDKMSDQQLAQAERIAMARGDKERLAMIAEEKAMRASERRGLASAFDQMPQQAQQQMLQAARGGIVAFSGEGDSFVEEEEAVGGDGLYDIGRVDTGDFTPMTPGQRQAAIAFAQQREAQMRGASPLTPFIQDIVKQKEALGSRREENKGLIALAAAQALSRGSGLRRGLGEMFGAIGATAASVNKDLRDSERLIKQSELALAQAEEARKNMQFDKATALVDRSEALSAAAARANQLAALKKQQIESHAEQARLNRESAERRTASTTAATLEAARIQAERPAPDMQKITAIAEGLLEENPDLSPVQARRQATELFMENQRGTDTRRLAKTYLDEMLALDPTIKNDPLRLAAVKSSAENRAAREVRGIEAREISARAGERRVGVSEANLRLDAAKQAILDPEYNNAGRVLRNPQSTEAQREEARRTQERVIDRIMGASEGAGVPRGVGVGTNTNDPVSVLRAELAKPGANPAVIKRQYDTIFGPGAADRALGK